jgi:hypothetical protein
MAPTRGKKRKSDCDTTSELQNAVDKVGRTIATNDGTPSESPRKKRRVGITLAQKQALIDNLQLESMPF